MPAGLEAIFNNHGSVLLDDNYHNLAVVAEGTQANWPGYDGASLIAVRSADFAQTSYQWWKFGDPVAPVANNAGLQVFNASGALVFDSRLRYARVVDVFAGPTLEVNTVTRTYTAGRTYAVITAKRANFMEQEVRDDPFSPPGWYNYRRRWWSCRARYSGASIIAGWHALAWGDWSGALQVIPNPITDDRVSQFMVLDVTGY